MIPFWKTSSFWSAVAALLSFVATAALVCLASRAETVTLEGQLREQMSRYLTENSRVADALQDPYSLPGYLALSQKDRRRVEIVAGLQIGVVDLMFETKDPRREKWIGFLAIPGPIACWDMSAYASRQETLDEIKRDEAKLRPGVNCSSP